MPSVIWTKGPGGVRLVQCLGGEGAPSGGSGSLALAVSLYATTLSTAAIGTIGRPISHRDSTIFHSSQLFCRLKLCCLAEV